MDALQRLEICKQCEKRKFGNNGIICSLTEAKATFTSRCPDFVTDQKAAQRATASARYKLQEEEEQSSSKSIWWIIGVILVIIRLIIRFARD